VYHSLFQQRQFFFLSHRTKSMVTQAASAMICSLVLTHQQHEILLNKIGSSRESPTANINSGINIDRLGAA
jgi:hypothetical protein